jgi:hypothetical protein
MQICKYVKKTVLEMGFMGFRHLLQMGFMGFRHLPAILEEEEPACACVISICHGYRYGYMGIWV